MELRLHESVLEALHGKGVMQEVEVASKRSGYVRVHVGLLGIEDLEGAVPVLESFGNQHRSHLAMRAIQSLLAARTGDASAVRINAAKEAPGILRAYLMDAAPDRLLWAHVHDHWMPYLIRDIEYVNRFGDQYVAFRTRYWEAGKVHNHDFEIPPSAVTGSNAPAVLASAGLLLTNSDVQALYDQDLDAWRSLDGEIGLQLTGTGYADPVTYWSRMSRRPSYSRHSARRLEQDGRPARLVVDVYFEDGDEDQDAPRVSTGFWSDGGGTQSLPAPIHPRLMAFDLRRHQHVLVNAGDVEAYQYDEDLADQLVLPPRDRALIEMLMGSSGREYQDIVAGKGGGVIVLSSGPPGTGKTLTAEVQAERLHMPLDVVQSSQLGVTADELEKQLRIVLARAARWNALLLIDEADVYIHARGNNLHQNAVVGVFLRLLEYHHGHLFLATNREVIIDDAIISRATAHIRYEQPDADARAAIWRTLAKATGLDISEALAATMAQVWSWTSGRDIKNALKLLRLRGHGCVTRDALGEVEPYIPRTRTSTKPEVPA